MSRKYRQRGYMESDRDERRPRGKPAPRQNLTKEEKIQRRSLRHATNREAREVVRCHNCGRNVPGFGAGPENNACPGCRAPLRCCRACLHFDTSARWQCRAEISQPVGDKNMSNDCPSFQPRLVLDATGRRSGGSRGSGDPRSQFEDLFKR